MKTVFRMMISLAFIAVLFSGVALAQQSGTTKTEPAVSTDATFIPGTFVDKNNDGVCDNRETRPVEGRRRNFIDADGDGICDNARPSGQGTRIGKGRCGNGQGIRQRNGAGWRGRNTDPGIQPRKVQ